MKEVTIEVANTTPFFRKYNDTEVCFSTDELELMASQIEGIPVTRDFDHEQILGVGISGKVIDGKMMATINIDMDKIDVKNFLTIGYQFSNDVKTDNQLKKLTDLAVSRRVLMETQDFKAACNAT